jgi:hypothetical protein
VPAESDPYAAMPPPYGSPYASPYRPPPYGPPPYDSPAEYEGGPPQSAPVAGEPDQVTRPTRLPITHPAMGAHAAPPLPPPRPAALAGEDGQKSSGQTIDHANAVGADGGAAGARAAPNKNPPVAPLND